MSNDDELRKQDWRSPGTNSGLSKLQERRIHRETGRQTSCQEHWVWKPHFNLFVMHCVLHFFQSFMHYSAVFQQQQTGHGAHINSSTFGIDSVSWVKMSGDWPWIISPISHLGCGKSIRIFPLSSWSIMACSSFKLTFCQSEEWDAVCRNTSCIGPLWW